MSRVCCILLVMFTLLSCSRNHTAKSDNKIVIGFSASSEIFLQERWERDITIFTSRARELGAEVIFSKSAKNSTDQIAEVFYLLKQDIDVLVVIPRDRDILKDAIKRAKERGIYVVTYDRLIMGVPIDGYISFDNQEVGKLMAQALVSKVPEGNYLIINGSVRDNNSFEVNQGLTKELSRSVVNNRISIAENIWMDDWSYDEAYRKINDIFDKRTDIDAISGANDMMAQAAIKVLLERRLAGKVVVVGQDADLSACQSIVDGTQFMSVYKPIQRLATRAAEITVAIAQGESPEPDLYINNNSGRGIPYFIERPIPVFKNNIDKTIIEDGFHSKEDIYR